MYANPGDIKKHRFNLSANDTQRAQFLSEAQATGMQPTSLILELAIEALQWRLHARNSSISPEEMRRANA